MKINSSSITIGIFFILGAGAGWIAEGKHVDYLFSHYIPAVVTLLAAYYGAKFAFDFQRGKEKQEEANRQIISGNLAVFKIVTMINSLLTYQRQIIDPIRGKDTAFLEMSPTLPQEKENVHIDINTLAFLLGTDEQNLVGELSVEQARYEAAIAAINERSKVHRYEVQPVLDAAGIVNGRNYFHEDIQRVLGERLFHTLHQATDQVIYHVDTTISSLKEVADKLSVALKKQFPGSRIISVSMPEDLEKAESPTRRKS